MIIPAYLVTLWALLFVGCGPTVAQSVAVFDFELIDTSLEGAIRGARLDEQERLARLGDQLRQLLRDSGRFALVDITPIARKAQASNLQACGGCDMLLARRIGAELAITGTVQKVSNLILNMNIYVREASSGATIAAVTADMRGNTDESWSCTRALVYEIRSVGNQAARVGEATFIVDCGQLVPGCERDDQVAMKRR